MACVAFVCGCSGESTSRLSRSLLDKISSVCSKNEAGGRRPFPVEAMCAFFFSCCLGGNSYFLMGYVCIVVVSLRLPHKQAMVHSPLLMSFLKEFFNTL